MAKEKLVKRKFDYFINFLIFLLIVGGIVLIAYPFVTQYLYRNKAINEINIFKKEARLLGEEEINRRMLLAQGYNEALQQGVVKSDDPYINKRREEGVKEYARMLEVAEKIGSIQIPKIGQDIPIYAGTGENVLQKGVGHMEGSSLPIGGNGVHTILTAHRGLPTARLFTDLDELESGDRIYVENIKETIAYQVTGKEVIKPNNFKSLVIEDGKDQLTLLTCTPYLVNSHRLLVHAQRIDYVAEVRNVDIRLGIVSQRDKYLFYGVGILAGLVFILNIKQARKLRRLSREFKLLDE